MNVFLEEIKAVLPRILGSINRNNIHPSYGVSDRRFWAWRTIDFGNGTNQGVADGLSLLLKNEKWPYKHSTPIMVERIESLFLGTEKIMRKNGSLEESFPYEGSWCVSALVSFHLLNALENIKDHLTLDKYEKYLQITAKILDFVSNNPESHAKISNHLAAAAASLYKYYSITGSKLSLKRGEEYLELLSKYQNKDGSFIEYFGFDPGYQTLTMDYLADIYLTHKIKNLDKMITNSLEMINYFVFPDGTFGGNFGARGTQVYYPGGIARLSNDFQIANEINLKMRNNIQTLSSVSLRGIDEGNLAPLFNSYAQAAMAEIPSTTAEVKDFEYEIRDLKFLEESGFVIDKKNTHYSVISIFKGGYFEHFKVTGEKVVGRLPILNANNKYLTAQIYNPNNSYEIEDNRISIKSQLGIYKPYVQKPVLFIASRVLFGTLNKNTSLKNILKKIIAKKIFKNKYLEKVTIQRVISTGENIDYYDKVDKKLQNVFFDIKHNGSLENMASANYWKIQDEWFGI